MKFSFPLLVLIVLGSTQTAKITNHDEEVVKKADEQLDLGLDLDSLLSLDLDLDRMALEAEDFVRKFGVDETTLKDVKSYLNQNEMIANTARSAKNSLSKGKEMLRKVLQCAIVKYFAAQFHESGDHEVVFENVEKLEKVERGFDIFGDADDFQIM